MREKILSLINEVMEEKLKLEDVSKNQDIINDIGIDSIQIFNLILMIEEELGIEINFEEFDLAAISRFNDFCTYFENQVRC